MKNKQHKYILKAYLKSKTPNVIKDYPNLIVLDEYLAGYAARLLGSEKFKVPNAELISEDEKLLYSKLINSLKGNEKEETLIYYRLTVLVGLVLSQYTESTDAE